MGQHAAGADHEELSCRMTRVLELKRVCCSCALQMQILGDVLLIHLFSWPFCFVRVFSTMFGDFSLLQNAGNRCQIPNSNNCATIYCNASSFDTYTHVCALLQFMLNLSSTWRCCSFSHPARFAVGHDFECCRQFTP